MGALLSCAAPQGAGAVVPSSKPVRFRLENQLSACVLIEKETVIWSGDVPMLELRYALAKSTAECGCKSALSAYASYAQVPDGERYLIGGPVTLSGDDAVTLPLAADADLLGDAALRVSLGCERPD
jgi:hypothetical protein